LLKLVLVLVCALVLGSTSLRELAATVAQIGAEIKRAAAKLIRVAELKSASGRTDVVRDRS
jgi:Sec-independent protein translocase protein TatA